MRFRYSAIALVAIVLGTACGGGAASGKASAQPVNGGTLKMAIWQEPNNLLYPFYSSQTVAWVTSEVAIEGLVRPDPDGSYVPTLAREVPSQKNGLVKVAADGKSMDVTYHLLPGIKWADGEPLTSADVQYTWKLIVTDPKINSTEGYSHISAVDTPDDLTAIVHYRDIYAAYESRFGYLLPKHVLASVSDVAASAYARTPFGTGPFKFTENVSGDHLTAVRNTNYRVKGRPYLDRIIFRSVPSREVAVAQLKAGEVDSMWNLLESQVPDIKKQADLKVLSVTGPTVERLEFNLAKPGNPADPAVPHPVLGDLAMRHALELATPKQKIIDKLLNGLASPGTSPVSIGYFSPKDLKQDSYDPGKAKGLLEAVGWKPGGDGIRSKAGVRAHLTIVTTSGDKIREEVEQVLVDEWKQIGVELEIKNVPSSVLFGSWAANAPRKRGNFDVNMYASSPDADPQETVAQRFHTRNIPTAANNGAGFNYNRFSSPSADGLIDQATNTLDLDKRRGLYAQILKQANDQYTNVWIYNRAAIDGFRVNVGGYRGNPWDNLTWNAQDLYIHS